MQEAKPEPDSAADALIRQAEAWHERMRELGDAAARRIAPTAVRDMARRLRLARLEDPELDDLCAMVLEDAVLHLARPGRTSPLDRLARDARTADPETARALAMMRGATLSFWRAERAGEPCGLVLRDLLAEREVLLVDERLDDTEGLIGTCLLARLAEVEGFWIAATLLTPIGQDQDSNELAAILTTYGHNVREAGTPEDFHRMALDAIRASP